MRKLWSRTRRRASARSSVVIGIGLADQVRAYDLLRMFGREGHPDPLGQAFAEYGRIPKTLHLLAVVDPTRPFS